MKISELYRRFAEEHKECGIKTYEDFFNGRAEEIEAVEEAEEIVKNPERRDEKEED